MPTRRVNGHAKTDYETALVPAPFGTTWEEVRPFIWAALSGRGVKWLRLAGEVREGVITGPDGTTYDLTDNNVVCFRVEYGK